MKKREIIYDDQENFLIWSEWEDGVELIAVYGDKCFYYCPGQLLDMVLFTDLLKRMNIGQNDRDNIRNYVLDLYDQWRGAKK